MVTRKKTVFRLWKATDKNVVSLVSSVKAVMPISYISCTAVSCHVPTVAIAKGWKIWLLSNLKYISIFTARAYSRAVLGVVILSVRLSVCPSVRPSVCLSHACIVKKLNDALQIFLYHTKAQSLCYSDTKSGWSATPPSLWNLRSKWPTPFEKRRLRPISAHNVSTVGDSEKSSITTNIKPTTGFPTSHRWSAYVTPKCPKGWLREQFFRFWV